MKVLIINEVCGTGSTGRICVDLADNLDKLGHEVKIAYGRDGQVPEQYKKYAVRIGTDIDVKFHAIKTRLFDATGFGSRNATKKFIKWIMRYNPDIIHLHNLHGYYINIEILFDYLKISEKKVIWTMHDCWAYTGHSAYCDVVECTRWMDGCHKCPQKLVYPKSYVDRSNKNWKKKKVIFSSVPGLTVVCPSEWLANQVRHSFLKEYPVMVINNGIDTNIFYPLPNDYKEKHGLEGKKIILSVATVWNDLKGYSDFLKLAKRISKEYRIIMVGAMDRALIKTLPHNIINIRRTDNVQEMAVLYNAADIFLNLTYCDTYPTVNLESVACGTPIITYAVGGSAESAQKYGGYTVKRGDINAVLEIIEVASKNKKSVILQDINELDKKNAIFKYINYYKEN